MGKVLTKIYYHGVREVKLFNIENRAQKVLSRDKPIPAPRHPSTILELQRLKEENVSAEYLNEKNNQLDSYLKKVYVTTPEPGNKNLENPNQRPLPKSRFTPDELVYGYSESEEKEIPVGRLSLKQALQFIEDHRTDPIKHSNTSIAAQYKLPVMLTDDILKHFQLFEVHWKKKEKDPASQSEYQKLKEKAENMTLLNTKTIVKNSPMFSDKRLFIKPNEEENDKNGNSSISKENTNIEQKYDEEFKSEYKKLEERVDKMNLLTTKDIEQNKMLRDIGYEKVKDNDNIKIDNSNSDKKDDKKKR